VTTAPIATTPKNTAPATCRSISGFALPPVIHNNQPLTSHIGSLFVKLPPHSETFKLVNYSDSLSRVNIKVCGFSHDVGSVSA
jgi:hypothetical protein